MSTKTLFTMVVLLVAGCEDRPGSSLSSATGTAVHRQGRAQKTKRPPAANVSAPAATGAAQQCPPGQKLCSDNTCKQCCATSDCKFTPEVNGAVCNADGTCSITSCVDRWLDVNKIYLDGCECANAIYPKSCDLVPPAKTIDLGATQTIIGDLPVAGEANWFSVSFAYEATPQYHPVITIASSSSSAFVFDVSSACGPPPPPLACPVEGTQAVGVMFWEVKSTGGDPNNKQNYKPTPPVGTVWIKVYRQLGDLACDYYTLTIQNSVSS